MKSKFFNSAALLLVGAIGIASVKPVLAADAPVESKTAPAPKVPAKLSATDMSTVLNIIDDYEMMLQKAGYTVKSGKTASGQKALAVSWKSGSWTFLTNIAVKEIDGIKYLSIISPLSNIPDMSKIPVITVVRLLEVQDATQGWFFVLNSKAKRFYIARLIPAKGVTTNVLLNELKTYQANVQGTEKFWNPARWVTKPANAPAKPEPEPAPTPAKPKAK